MFKLLKDLLTTAFYPVSMGNNPIPRSKVYNKIVEDLEKYPPHTWNFEDDEYSHSEIPYKIYACSSRSHDLYRFNIHVNDTVYHIDADEQELLCKLFEDEVHNYQLLEAERIILGE